MYESVMRNAGSIASALILLAAPSAAETPLSVTVVVAQHQERNIAFAMAGTIEARDYYAASFRDGGRITEVLVNAGDRVAAGQPLARIDPTQAAASFTAARAQLDGAEAALLQAEQNYDRLATLLDRGTATRAEVDTATQTRISAMAARDQAQAALDKAQTALADTVLTAKEPAIVTAREAEVGQVVAAGTPVLSLAVAGDMVVEFLAPDGPPIEDYLGQTIDVTLMDDPKLHLTAVLDEVSPVVDTSTATVSVSATLTGDLPDMILLGEPVIGKLEIAGQDGTIVPWTALTSTAQGQAVWTVDGADQVHLTPVQVAEFLDDSVVLTGGVADGTRIVAGGSHLLYEGRLVAGADQ